MCCEHHDVGDQSCGASIILLAFRTRYTDFSAGAGLAVLRWRSSVMSRRTVVCASAPVFASLCWFSVKGRSNNGLKRGFLPTLLDPLDSDLNNG